LHLREQFSGDQRVTIQRIHSQRGQTPLIGFADDDLRLSGLLDDVVHWLTSVARSPFAMTKNILRTFALGLNFAGTYSTDIGTARAHGNVTASASMEHSACNKAISRIYLLA